jgi:hypothetical protein
LGGGHTGAEIVFDVQAEMAFELGSEFMVAAVPVEETAKSQKPSAQLPHKHSSRRVGLQTGHYNDYS